MIDRALSMLIYGKAKVGKTTFAVETSPAPRLVLDVESSSRFIKGKKVYWDPVKPPPADDGTWDICIVSVDKFEVALKAFEWLSSGKHPFKTVILDSISELQVKAQESVNGRSQMQTQHWGQLLNKISFFGRDLRDLTTNKNKQVEAVIITATEKITTSENLPPTHAPFLQGQVAGQIPYWYDICGYYYATQDKAPDGSTVKNRNLLIGDHPQYESGNRVPGLEDVLFNPNITDILDQVFGEES